MKQWVEKSVSAIGLGENGRVFSPGGSFRTALSLYTQALLISNPRTPTRRVFESSAESINGDRKRARFRVAARNCRCAPRWRQ